LIPACAIQGPGGLDPGIFTRATNFFNTTWTPNTANIKGDPICLTLAGDEALQVAEALAWTHQHTGSRNTDTTLAPPLAKLTFLRAGSYQMQINLDLKGISYPEMMLTFRDNALTQGDFTGATGPTIPVFLFNQHTYTGPSNILYVTVRQPGRYSMVLRLKDGSGNYYMMEMEWVVVA
jgi:hypothetical protein